MTLAEAPSTFSPWSINDFLISKYVAPDPSTSAPRWDLFIAACGFENRASFVHQHLGGFSARTTVAEFDSRRELSFEKNLRYFSRAGASLSYLSDREYGAWIVKQIAAVSQSKGADAADQAIQVAVDISSLSRQRIASLVEVLAVSRWPSPLSVSFLYAPASSTRPHTPGEVAVCQPVTAFFSGFSLYPGRPPTAVLGLGYEVDRAVGVVEYLEAEDVYALRPHGVDRHSDRAVDLANETLMLRPSQRVQVVDYDVQDPFGLFVNLESLLHGLRLRRPTIIPMGPKIFALAALVAAAIHLPNAAVWRVSAGESEAPVQRNGRVPIVGLDLTVRPVG